MAHDSPERHGGNREAWAQRLGCRPHQLLDASASLVPFGPPPSLRRHWPRLGASAALTDYPDRAYTQLRQLLADHHGLDPALVLPGNGAAELFTWAARDAAATGPSLLPTPGFADYRRALACWEGPWQPLPLPLVWTTPFPSPFPAPTGAQDTAAASVLWITNPHNPTGQLWSRATLEPLLARHPLVIVDEAFLPLTLEGEGQSLIPLVPHHPNLVVIRSLTKQFRVAGLRLGYALGDGHRLARWARWRDPWPVNGLAAAAAALLLADRRWPQRLHRWLALEAPWLQQRLARFPGLTPMPSATNFLLLQGDRSLQPLRLALAEQARVLVRDCRSFEGLGDRWLRLALLERSGHRRLLRALARLWPCG